MLYVEQIQEENQIYSSSIYNSCNTNNLYFIDCICKKLIEVTSKKDVMKEGKHSTKDISCLRAAIFTPQDVVIKERADHQYHKRSQYNYIKALNLF